MAKSKNNSNNNNSNSNSNSGLQYLTKDNNDIDWDRNKEINQGRKFAAGVLFYNDKYSLKRCLDSMNHRQNVDVVFCIDGRFKQFGEKGKDPDLSTDGSRELVLSYDNTVLIDAPDAWEVQKREKYLEACRHFGIDYLLILDSDEYILYDEENPLKNTGTIWEKFVYKTIQICENWKYKNHHVFAVEVETGNKAYVDTIQTMGLKSGHLANVMADSKRRENIPVMATMPYRRRKFMHLPRLWHNPGEMKYNGKHYTFHPRDPSHPQHILECVSSAWTVPFLNIGHDHSFKKIHTDYQAKRLRYQQFLVNFEGKMVNQIIISGKTNIRSEDMDQVEKWYEDYQLWKQEQKDKVMHYNRFRQNVKDVRKEMEKLENNNNDNDNTVA